MTAIVTQDAGALANWDPNSGAALPAYMADALGEMGTNILDRNTVPSLSYEGKVWAVSKANNKTKLQVKNEDGDMVPVQVMRIIVLNFNSDRGRAFYEGAYNPAAAAAPTCWSADGVAPDPSVKTKQSAACTTCPMSVKGSKVDESGKEMIACSSHRMIAVLPAFDLAEEPLRLKIAVTSDWDKEVVEHGWFAFRQYNDFLKSRGIAHTAAVITKVKFDHTAAYPKLLFAIDRLVTPTELEQVKLALASPKVAELLAEKWTAAGVNGTQKDEADTRPYGLEGAYLDGWQAHPDTAGYSWKGKECVTNEELAARYPAPPPVEPAKPEVPASQQIIDQPAQTPAAPEPQTNPPPVVDAHDPLTAAMADGWAVHPDNPAYYWKGKEVILPDALVALYPAPPAMDVAPATPVAPEAPAAPVVDPSAAATADGWAAHPDNPLYWFKGQDVVLTTELLARYAGNGQTGAASSVSTGIAAGGTTGPTATTGASLSDGEVPADVQNLLDKWTPPSE